MKYRLTHILTTLWLTLAMLLAISCSHDERGNATPDAPEELATLSLTVEGVEGLSRAVGSPTGEIEGMRQLRIIILDADRKVEANRLIDFGDRNPDSYFDIFAVKPNEQKRIYAIANPASTDFPFESYQIGSQDMDKALENYAYNFDCTRPIAMCDSREMTSPAAGNRTDVTLNLARIATKFTVKITNDRIFKTTVKSFAINSLSEKQYLIPHFTGDGDKHVVNEEGLKGFDFDSQTGMHWSDWLKLAVDESQKDPTDRTLADRRGWIMKYAVPTDASPTRREFTLPAKTEMDSYGGMMTLPVHYFAESRSGVMSVSEFGNGAGSNSEQEYTFDLETTARTFTGEIENRSFKGVKLPNLRALFRNTHVVVNITLGHEDVACEVDVIPYAEIILKPDYGLDRDNETGWIVINMGSKKYFYDDHKDQFYNGDKQPIARRVERGENGLYLVRDHKTKRLKYSYDFDNHKYYRDEEGVSQITQPDHCDFLKSVQYSNSDQGVSDKWVTVLRFDEYGKAICMYDPTSKKAFNDIWSPLDPIPNYAIQKWENAPDGSKDYLIISVDNYRSPVFFFNTVTGKYYFDDVNDPGIKLVEVEAYPPLP